MAEDRKVRINIETKGDPKGANQAADALERVAEAQRDIHANPMTDGSQLSSSPEKIVEVAEGIERQTEATEGLTDAAKAHSNELERIQQQEADLAAARTKRNERELEEIRKNADAEVKAAQEAKIALGLKAAALGGIIATWNTLTGSVREQISALRAVSPEAAKQFEAVEDGLEALSNPIRAALLPAIRETQEEIGLLEQALKNAAAAEAQYQQARKDKAAQQEATSRERIEGTLKRELQIIEDQNAAYERQQRLVDGIRALEEARARVSDANRIAAGEDPGTVKAEAESRQVQTQSAGVDQRVLDAEHAFNQAAEAAQSAIDALAGASDLSRKTLDLSARADEAVRVRDDLKLELETVRQEAVIEKEKILTEAIGGIQSIAPEVGAGVTEAANEAIGIIEAKAEEQGGKISGDAKRVLDELYRMVQDNIPDQEQAGRLESLLSQFRVSTEGRDRAIYGGITDLMNYAAQQERRFAELQRQVSELRQRSIPMAPAPTQ